MSDLSGTVPVLLKLIRQNTSLSVVSDFLKSQELHYSASKWDDMIEKRIRPALDEGEITTNQLESLLISSEEFGRQHIFLYKCSNTTANELMDEERVAKAASDTGLKEVYEGSKILDAPGSLTISDIRFDEIENKKILVIKLVETKWREEFAGEEADGGYIIKRWRKISERAVNVVRLHQDGLLEIRLASHKTPSSYFDECNKIKKAIEVVLSTSSFREVSLSKVKNTLLNDKSALKEKIRFTNATLKNDRGNTIRAAVGSPKDDLSDDSSVNDSMDNFLQNSGYCDGTNIWFIKNDGSEVPRSDIHVVLQGEMNEFVVPGNCINLDYEYVLKEIKQLNS